MEVIKFYQETQGNDVWDKSGPSGVSPEAGPDVPSTANRSRPLPPLPPLPEEQPLSLSPSPSALPPSLLTSSLGRSSPSPPPRVVIVPRPEDEIPQDRVRERADETVTLPNPTVERLAKYEGETIRPNSWSVHWGPD